jgi:LmbE family N-acetylglucosaminyl deacetylase
MKTRGAVVVALLLGLVAAALLRAAPEAAPTRAPEQLLRAKVEAARKTYEVVWRNNKEGLVPFAELVYRWSRRWLEAELDLSDKKEAQVTAHQAHAERMLELTRFVRDRYRNRINTIEEVTSAEFFTAEAAIWLDAAKKRGV